MVDSHTPRTWESPMAEDFAEHEKFDRTDYTDTPLLKEIESLAASTDQSLDEFEKLTMRQIHDIAVTHYGKEKLPEIWVIWADYNRPDLEQYMGDL